LLFTSPRSCISFYSTGLTKKTETFIFFQISDVGRFRRNLLDFVPLVKTVAQVQDDLAVIQDNKKQAAHKGNKPQLIPLAGANIAFSRSGLTKVLSFQFLTVQRGSLLCPY
jgi:deferrochelatase/peroxidase EfeB